jgi:hypothetical protein
MKMIKTAFIAVFAVFTFTSARAADLNGLNKDAVQKLTADLALPAPSLGLAGALLPKAGLDPVVITIPGLKFGEIGWGPLELKYILKIIKQVFPGNKMVEADIANGLVSLDNLSFSAEDTEAAGELAQTAPQKAMPDNYLELKLKELPGYADHDIKIIPFGWSRDPADTEVTVPALERALAAAYDANKNSGRPIYILAHSWGSVLTHEAMHNLAVSRPDVRIDKLITAGCPLVPGNFVVSLFMKAEIAKEHLRKTVSKPAGVKVWHNIWSSRDPYSNSVPAADANYQTDTAVENVEPALVDLFLHNKLLRKEARGDLFKIRDIKAWHASYFFDFTAKLTSINKEISVEIFRPVMAPQVMSCDKKPAAPLCVP